MTETTNSRLRMAGLTFLGTCLMLFLGSMKANGTPKIAFVDLPVSGTVLLAGGSNEFRAALETRAEPPAVAALQALIPYCVIVHNQTPLPLIAVVVRWELTDSTGKKTTRDYMLSTMDTQAMIPPGSMAFMAPMGGLNAVLKEGNRGMSLNHTAQLGQVLNHTADVLAGQREVTVSLDSIAYADGEVVGPDRTRNIRRMNAWIYAERTLAAELAGRRGPELADHLTRVVNAPEKQVYNLGEVDHVDSRRRSAAQMALMRLSQNDSDEEFAAYLTDRVQRLIPTLHRRGQ